MRQLLPYCLASGSPRRAELMRLYGLHFQVWSARLDERPLEGEGPEALVGRLAREKAQLAARLYPGHLILAGDTVVAHEGRLLGKPAHVEEAQAMLRSLSGATHQVLTGYHLLQAGTGRHLAGRVETQVTFRPLSAQWIAHYTAQAEPHDKAGAYAIQGLGGVMVERIEGSFNNVVGFPMEHIFWDLVENGWLEI